MSIRRYGKARKKPSKRARRASASRAAPRLRKRRRKVRGRFRCDLHGKVYKTRAGLERHLERHDDFDDFDDLFDDIPLPRVRRKASTSGRRGRKKRVRPDALALPKKPRRGKKADARAPRVCAVCGDPTDHGGDGHPYEAAPPEEREVVYVRPRHRPFPVRPPLAFRDADAPVTGAMAETHSKERYNE